MTLRIHNTLTRRVDTFVPIEPGHVRMYVCGMTIYDLCHMGHARFLMAFDVVYRWLQTMGLRVTYVRNITDIDDKIIRRALERQMPIAALTAEMTDAMHADIGALGILRPTFEPRATEHIDGMLKMIGRLQSKGLAYQAAGGDVNFSVRKVPSYGKLSGKSIDQLRAGERVAVDDGKQDPLDFVLWKAAKDDEPEDAKWNGPFGRGRPGWHIECSAMCEALLGTHFDIHGGGIDLQFPHHENEIAQSEGANDGPFVNVWVHNGHLTVDNEKISKSLGNFFTIRDVLKRYDGETLRFFMLRTHYRSPFNFSDAHIDDARQALRRLYVALDGVATEEGAAIDWAQPQAAQFMAAMNDDFNTPIALAVLFELANELNRTKSSATATLLKALAGTLGVLQLEPRVWLQSGSTVDAEDIQVRIEARLAAKRAGDLSASRCDSKGSCRRRHPPARHPARHDLGPGLTMTEADAALASAAYWDDACKHLAKRDRVMRKLIPTIGDGRLRSRGDAFTTLARSIVGQQISGGSGAGGLATVRGAFGRGGQATAAGRRARARCAGHPGRRPLRPEGRIPERPGRAFRVRRGSRRQLAAHGRRGDHRGADRDPRHRPLDGGDVLDLPPDAPQRAAARRRRSHQGHQRELLQRRAGLQSRGA